MNSSKIILPLLIVLLTGLSVEMQDNLPTQNVEHGYLEIENHKLSLITRLSDEDHLKRTVREILIPRVVGTEGHDKVRDFITDSMKKLNWDVTSDTFRDKTPNRGTLTFENIIATHNPKAEKFLVLACHYDSKYFPNKDEEFLGATDSAVPCAMLINMAYVLKDYLATYSKSSQVSLMFIFFDGEEAFMDWSPKDSIYGARHLAERWEREDFLKRIDLFILLDLLGTPHPNFYSFFDNTVHWYNHLLFAEERLSAGGYLENYTTNSVIRSVPNRYFQPNSVNSFIEDDHLPFWNRNVPILHIIPVPFPECWHQMSDNHDVIDYSTVENLNKILRIFVVEYLNIEV